MDQFDSLQGFSGGVRFKVQVKPRSRETKLVVEDGEVILRVMSAPERGAANKEVVKWFAKKLQMPASQVRIISGFRSRTKIIELADVSASELANVLGLC